MACDFLKIMALNSQGLPERYVETTVAQDSNSMPIVGNYTLRHVFEKLRLVKDPSCSDVMDTRSLADATDRGAWQFCF